MKLKSCRVTVSRSERTVVGVRAADQKEAAEVGRFFWERGMGTRLPGLISVKSRSNQQEKAMIYTPMRPGIEFPNLDRYDGPLPEGEWQPKLNDERGWWVGGILYNRHMEPMPARKMEPFRKALDMLPISFPVDLALLGFRTGPWKPGCVVVLDYPGQLTRRERYEWLSEKWPLFTTTTRDLVSILPSFSDPRACWVFFRTSPGFEGIIWRRPGAGYQSGKSKEMGKAKWI